MKLRLLSYLTLIFALFLPLSYAQERTPKDVVAEWTQTYGSDMTRAAALTTPNFRKGQSEEIWAEKIGRALREIEYKHLQGKIMEERIEADKALIVLESEISTKVNAATQKELYFLRKIQGKWLIDELIVKDEQVQQPQEKT